MRRTGALSLLALVLAAGCQPAVTEHSTTAAAEPETAAEEPDGREDASTPADPAVASIREFIATKAIDTSSNGWKTRLPKPEVATFTPDATYYWNLETSEGPVKIKLMPDVAPMHVTSTIYLTQLGFYDGLKFHRVITNFMAQGGCPLGNGTAGPGYKYSGEFDPNVRHDRPGLLSMANAGPGTDGSQFFLTFVETPWLDGKHTIFGEVVEGMDTLKRLESFGSPSGATSKPLLIEKATITVE